MHRARGFSLIEVLVAVAIVALALPALLLNTMQQMDGTAYLREKIIASWVASNALTEIQIRHRTHRRVAERQFAWRGRDGGQLLALGSQAAPLSKSSPNSTSWRCGYGADNDRSPTSLQYQLPVRYGSALGQHLRADDQSTP